MVFKVKNKVALVTGGAQGIGLSHVKELLKQGAKGVVIADKNEKFGEQQTNDLKKEFGENKVFFVRTDTSDYNSFENAFKITIQHFGNIDILINNAGICNDRIWEKEIDINLKGTVYGTFLGLETYLRNFKQGDEAVIINTSSTCLVDNTMIFPVYVSTKFGILGLTKELGSDTHYERTKVKVIAICPGPTVTALTSTGDNVLMNEEYESLVEKAYGNFDPLLVQSPEVVAEETIKVIEKAPNGSFWIIENTQPAYQYILPEKNIFIKNVL